MRPLCTLHKKMQLKVQYFIGWFIISDELIIGQMKWRFVQF